VPFNGGHREISAALGVLEAWEANKTSVGFRNASGPLVFAHACKLGLEGIVSKRKDSRYRSGRSPYWIKSKNPNAPAVRREAEEEWGR
jgi:ATP-dependent DNA ligase